jgi:hypothetical protein
LISTSPRTTGIFLIAEMESLLRLISGERIALRGLIFVMSTSSSFTALGEAEVHFLSSDNSIFSDTV